MKTSVVIPSYWGRKGCAKEGDIIYDHPTPLNEKGTLMRCLKSIKILKDKNFRTFVIAVPTAKDIEREVELKVKKIAAKSPVKTSVFGPSNLRKIKKFLKKNKKDEFAPLLSLRGYSNIRNLCLFIPHIYGCETVILIDDDEVFEDADFIKKAKEFIGLKFKGEKITAIAGYYLQPDGNYLLKKTFLPFMKYWDKNKKMNEAFRKFIGKSPRIKKTPFVFGGNMVISRDLFTKIPFDPNVPRGEDIDFLINAKMFGFSFFLDNSLSIKHLPPEKTHPAWKNLRQDFRRFIYEREKLRKQKKTPGMKIVKAESFDPYPGCFLKNDLDDKISSTSKLLSILYLKKNEPENAREALNNIILSKTSFVPEFNPFENLITLQKKWQKMMSYFEKKDVRSKIKELFEE